jgi:hypothetical protein
VQQRVFLFLVFLHALIGSIAFSDEDSIRGFIAVEPFEIRLEAIVKVEAYRQPWRLDGEAIDATGRQSVLDNVTTLLETGVNLTSPGQEIEFTGRSVRFIQPDPEKGYATDERDSIPVSEALVGITLSADARNVREFTAEWLWFAPGQERLVVEIASRGKPSARYVTPESNRIEWKLEDTVSVPEMLPVPLVIRDTKRSLHYLLFVGIAMLLVASIVVIQRKQKSPAWVGWLVIGGVTCAFFSFTTLSEQVLRPEEGKTEEIVYSLLRNIYHAFDFRDESAIYDTLEKSVSGPLLEKVYLEIRQSLELENTGGPRVRVYEIALREANWKETAEAGSRDEFPLLANWATIGEVTHWGHTHERTNRYEAEITLSPAGPDWKIVGLELLNEERVQKVSRRITEPASSP